MTRKCPQCKKSASLAVDNDHRPFCSERCQLIDLGAWLDGDYAISGEKADSDNVPDRRDQNLLE
ncbi:MAG: endogenous inhibitor of DNA gyrase (YacG/DUF329 family) [Myxococcota bacterium]